jgi:hypothetical protein
VEPGRALLCGDLFVPRPQGYLGISLIRSGSPSPAYHDRATDGGQDHYGGRSCDGNEHAS